MKILGRTLGAAIAAAALAPHAAYATDGYFSHGYGMKGKGMAGATTALAEDAFGGANNPAAMIWSGDRIDAGLDIFSPRRRVDRTGSMGGALDFGTDSGSNYFYIPEFGYNKVIRPDLSLGVTVYGNGGMNTDYPGGQLNCTPFGGPPTANGLCGLGRLGVDLSQLIVAPTVSWRFHPDHSVGIAPLFAYQRFRMEGAQLFTQLSQSAANVTNNGYDSSTGWGARVGYMGRLSPMVTIGAAYSTKLRMGKFDKYKGLFAGDGGFDLPENYSIGVAVHATPELLFALDYKRINYNAIASVGNASTNQAPLGSANGPGFGWQNVGVVKAGVEWRMNPALTLRAGYGHTDNPILARDVSFNILAPGVVKDHYTLGLTWALQDKSELTVAYMHAMSNSVTGPSFFNAFAPGAGGNEKIQMYENSLGVAWGRSW